MSYDIILRKNKDKYVARVRDWPELFSEEDTREAAITQIKKQLVDYLSQSPEIVQVDLAPMKIEKDTHETATPQIKEQLATYLSQPLETIQIDLAPLKTKKPWQAAATPPNRKIPWPVEASPTKNKNPWLEFAGMWADDPTWEDFLFEVDSYRQHIDEANPVA